MPKARDRRVTTDTDSQLQQIIDRYPDPHRALVMLTDDDRTALCEHFAAIGDREWTKTECRAFHLPLGLNRLALIKLAASLGVKDSMRLNTPKLGQLIHAKPGGREKLVQLIQAAFQTMSTQTHSQQFFKSLLDDVIKPNAEAVAKIITVGEIAVAVYKPGDMGEQVAHGLGWDGEESVFKMSSAGRKRMIDSLRQRNPVTVRWLKGGRTGRVFVISADGSLVMNLDIEQGKGWYIEPGSTNAEYLS